MDFGNYYTWEETQNACPPGWRLPTDSELSSLSGRGVLRNHIYGFEFGTKAPYIFMPATGKNNGAYYWGGGGKKNEVSNTINAYYLYFGMIDNLRTSSAMFLEDDKLSVRCVAKDPHATFVKSEATLIANFSYIPAGDSLVLLERIKTLKTDTISLNNQIRTLQNQLSTANGKISTLTTEKKDAQRQIDYLSTQTSKRTNRRFR